MKKFSNILESQIAEEIDNANFDAMTAFAVRLAMSHFIYFFNYNIEQKDKNDPSN